MPDGHAPSGRDAQPDVAPPEVTRLSVRLSPESRAALEQIIKLGNMDTMQEAIRRAIGDELFFLKQRADGWDVLLRKGKRHREVTWSL